jgi:hypothetical protein
VEKCQDRAPLQLATDDQLASGINSVNLNTDLAMSKPIHGTRVPAEEPSTA